MKHSEPGGVNRRLSLQALKRGVTMNENPYASPEHVPEEDFTPQGGHLPVTLTRVDSREVARRAWEVYARWKWWSFAIVFVGLVLAGVMLWLFADITMWQLRSGMWSKPWTALTVLCAVVVIVIIPANIVALTLTPMMRGLTGLAREEKEPDESLFSGAGFTRSGAAYAAIMLLGWGVLMGVVFFSADAIFGWEVHYVEAEMDYGAPPLTSLGRSVTYEFYVLSTGCFLTLVWLTFTLPGFWLIVEKKMAPFRALATSVRMIGYNIPCVLRLWLRCGLLLLAGTAAFGVGLCWALPLVVMHFIVFCMMAAGEDVPYQPQA